MLARVTRRFSRGLLAAIATALAGCGSWADDTFCASPGCAWTAHEWQLLHTLSPLPDPPLDTSNRWAGNAAAAALGRRLYFDPAFSGPARQLDALGRPAPAGRVARGDALGISCASCHDLGRGGADVLSVPGNVSSIGAGVTDVNALPVINAAYHRTVFWNGRSDSLWSLNVVVAESPTTLNGNRLQTAHVLAARYADAMAVFSDVLPAGWTDRVRGWPTDGKPGAAAYDALPESDRQLATTLLVLWSKAIAAFEQRLVSRDAPFDAFVRDGPASSHVSEGAKRGARLFVGKAGCIDCHSGPLLSDDDFHDVGAPQLGPGVPTERDCAAGSACDCVVDGGKNCLPWGARNGLPRLRDATNPWLRTRPEFSDDASNDPARALRSRALGDDLKGAWRTPSLRDVALTAPYMHDGAFATLEQVVWHYNDGGRGSRAQAVGTPAAQLKPLGLRADEVGDLVEFLRTLTGAPLPADVASPP
jgi:cytochrome c peroxidase